MAEEFPAVMSDREWSLILASGLAWAVGKLEGMDVEPGYAGQVLEHWRYPIRIIRDGEVVK